MYIGYILHSHFFVSFITICGLFFLNNPGIRVSIFTVDTNEFEACRVTGNSKHIYIICMYCCSLIEKNI